MSFKAHMTANQLLEGDDVIVSNVTERKASVQYDNAEDVKSYPYMVKLVVTKDASGVNEGQLLSIKLKRADLKIGQQFKFSGKTGATIPNGKVVWYSRNGFVNISVKGDEIVG
ncbi:hypothetical protein [Lactobacillus juensis]|uniref:hypothetical protein n=1 Tax=Lactobacillus juensis TaxID=3082862 RepID=UPI0030C6919B